MSTLPLIDLAAQQQRLAGLRARMEAVLAHGQYILGPEVAELEQALARRAGVAHCISCANGTDALWLVLKAWGIGAGDAVIVPAFTYAASAEAVAVAGATPVFADVDATHFTLDAASAREAITAAKQQGLTPRALMPVDLFGQPADYAQLLPLAQQAGLRMLCDSAQAFGARWQGTALGGIGDACATSFFPSKPLGCYGDGGAVLTQDDGLRDALVSLRAHGQGAQKHVHARIGANSRLDTLQAAVLLEKLTLFDEEIALRQQVATRYAQLLPQAVQPPRQRPHDDSVWAQYTIRLPDAEARTRVRDALDAAGIASMVYYPLPLHQQAAYAAFPRAALPVSEALCAQVLSLPMHPYLSENAQVRVAQAISAAL